jgi:hypothetical protein
MQPRILTYLVAAGAALAYTWGYGSRSLSLATAAPAAGGMRASIAGQPDNGFGRGARPVGTITGNPLTASVDVGRSGRDLVFTFRVTNPSERKLEVDFLNGKTHDLAVVDPAGREVWRWSAGQLFTQSVRNTPLDARETVTYTGRWHRPVGRGSFVAVGDLTSNNYPIESRTAFTLP